MSPVRLISEDAIDLLVASEVAGVGAVWIPVADGGPRWPAVEDPVANWRQAMVAGAHPVRRRLDARIDEVLSDRGAEIELLPGIWAIGSRWSHRGDAHAGVIVLPTSELATEGSFDMICNAARLDATLLRQLAEHTSMTTSESIPAVAELSRRLHRNACERIHDRASQASVDRRLAESYEELHLLNSLIDGLVLGDDADGFLRTACAELAATAGYRWIALLVEPAGSVVGEEQILHGTGVPTRTELRALAARAGEAVATTIDSENHGEVGIAAIRGAGSPLGTLIAGGRSGEPMSSVELTLLASAAGHVGVFLRNAMLYADLDSMFLGTLQAMVAAIDAKDPYTRGHSQRVALLSRDLAAAVGLPEDFVRNAHLAGLVHDIGKIGVPEAVLRKSGRLDDEEFALIRQHPQTGYRILKDIPQIRDLLPGVLCHHEAWNGTGYPAGLAEEEIPLLARIVAICDSFDAMSSSRTYRAAMPRDEVLAEIGQCAGRLYDPRLVPVFLGMDLTEYDRLLARDGADVAASDPGSDKSSTRRAA